MTTRAPYFGTDLYSVEDVDETRTVTGVALIAQDALWTLKTPTNQGVLEFDAPGYGLDLEGEIGNIDEAGTSAAALPDKIRSALKNDDRILEVETTVSRTVKGPAVEYEIIIRCETADGPFELVAVAGAEGFSLALHLLPGGI
jgi:hypothetical protein